MKAIIEKRENLCRMKNIHEMSLLSKDNKKYNFQSLIMTLGKQSSSFQLNTN